LGGAFRVTVSIFIMARLPTRSRGAASQRHLCRPNRSLPPLLSTTVTAIKTISASPSRIFPLHCHLRIPAPGITLAI
jgi:hypothetical protein